MTYVEQPGDNPVILAVVRKIEALGGDDRNPNTGPVLNGHRIRLSTDDPLDLFVLDFLLGTLAQAERAATMIAAGQSEDAAAEADFCTALLETFLEDFWHRTSDAVSEPT